MPFDFYDVLARLHGHRCPMSILGARLGLAARARLSQGTETRLTARYFHSTCALDGIQLATGCTLGNGNIRVEPRREHRLELWTEGGDTGVAATLTQKALRTGQSYGELRKTAAGIAPGPDRLRIEEEMEGILKGLEQAPESVLVLVEDLG